MPNTPRTSKRNNLSGGRLNLKQCFSKPIQQFTPKSPSPTATSSTVDQNHNRPSPPATSSTLTKNFNNNNNDRITVTPQNPFPSLGPEPEPADLATAFASQRFFFASPGRSNSIVESAIINDVDCTTTSPSPTPAPPDEAVTIDETQDLLKSVNDEVWTSDEEREAARALLDSSVAVTTYSWEPYADFRQSMEEMVAARPELMDVEAKWGELRQLLLCYLALNPKSTHRFILCAFSDLLLSLVSRSYSPTQESVPADVAAGAESSS